MKPKPDYKAAKRAKRERREKCEARLKKLVPLVTALSRKYGIEMTEIPSGYQFRIAEYIVSWWLRTNKIAIQFVGSSESRPFDAELVQGEPKVMTALKKLVRVTKGTGTSAT
jgi:hypothetical protein